MARVQLTGNAAEIKSGLLFPKGTYFMTVVDVEDTEKDGRVLTTKDGKWQKAVLEMVVAVGEWAEKGRLWHTLTFKHPGESGHGMALHALHALGMPYDGEIDFDLQDIKGRTVKVDVDIEPATDQYAAKNVIKRWHVLTDEEIAAQAFGNQPPASPEPGRPGWVVEGTAAGARTATAPRPAAPPPAPTPARKLPWGKK